MVIRSGAIISFLLFVVFVKPTDSNALDLYADIILDNQFTSNVYLDSQEEWDISFSPQLLTGADFSNYLCLEYDGRLDIYTRHADLLFQRHGLHFFVEPTWGEKDENAFTSELALVTQRNSETYAAIDYVQPLLNLELLLEPSLWLRWSVFGTGSYRLYYNDTASDSVDLWIGGTMTFTLPSKTTFGPLFRYGFRAYTRQDYSITDDSEDQQVEAGLHLSQSLSSRTGLNAGYAYIWAIGTSGLIERKLTHTEFSYIGEDFLYSGHRGNLGVKHLFEGGWSIGADIRYESRDYHGWEIGSVEGQGNGQGSMQQTDEETSADRQDQRLMPEAWIAYSLLPSESASRLMPDFSVKLEYEFLRQWSNDRLYDTYRHAVSLGLEVSW